MQGPSPAKEPALTLSGLDDAYQLCRRQGLRLSRQRRLVLEILWRSGDHLSAREIYEQLNADGRRIGHTSVYQNLESLHSHGVIECLEKAQGRLYGHRADSHSHLTCLESGSIRDLDITLPEPLLQAIQEQTGYSIENYSLNLQGRPLKQP
jgi:Fur family ferric uptake transcriptional regulator|tara:strand:+ start:9712 stop:10164 length:453 start_codon:yes stop_codon:yes gene_type:complete